MLSISQIAFYRDQGYLVVPDVLDATTLETVSAEMTRILEGARAVATRTDMYDLEPGHRAEDPRVRRVKTPHRFFPVFQRLMRHPTLIAILQDLLGPAVRLHGSKINLKSPRYGSPVEWHQDWAFYPHTNEDLVAVGVMLDDCTSDNGPLLVVPGSHRGPTFDHHADGYFCGAIDPKTIRDEIARAVPLTGRALMGVSDLADFDGRLITGEPSIEPRVVAAPVRMPLPPARHQGSIYENQSDASRDRRSPPRSAGSSGSAAGPSSRSP
jgi:phytanoyl-CoA hydroxylase